MKLKSEMTKKELAAFHSQFRQNWGINPCTRRSEKDARKRLDRKAKHKGRVYE